jgi:RNA polymerase sigma-70 factor (ECF subfamily)
MDAEFARRLMEHRSRLHAFVYALVRDPHLTEDILQEVAMVLFAKYAEFQAGTDFGAWAREVAYREIMSARRREWRARRPLDEAFAHEIWKAFERRRSGASSPPAAHPEALRRCLGTLGAGVRRVLDWRYAGGLSSEEIAARLRRTSQAVDALVYRTKRALADCVRRRLAGEGLP